MTVFLLILSISLYIISIVVSVVMALMYNRISTKAVSILLITHFVLLALAVILIASSYFNLFPANSASVISIVVFCFSLSIAGLILRTKKSLLLRGYFLLYLLSVILFVIAPSKLFSFIATGKFYTNQANTFQLKGDHFLELQSSMINQNDKKYQYKIYQKLGVFNKTISRNADFLHPLDSIKVIDFDANKSTTIRGYYHQQSTTDSTDKRIDLTVPLKENTITKGK